MDSIQRNEEIMHPITIADHIWLEPTLLGMTLNYSEGPQGLHFRVGMNLRSIKEAAQALQDARFVWAIRDGSFSFFGDDDQLVLTFTAGQQPVHRQFVLKGREVDEFKQAIGIFREAAIPRLN